MRRLRAVLVTALLFGGAAFVLSGCQTFTISGNVTWGETTIAAGDMLQFDPNVSSTLTMTGNLIIEGILQMRPAAPGVVHKIVFATANESAFVGGGMTPLSSDEGLWVVGGGQLDISGTPKQAWAKTTAGVPIGATTVTLDRDPSGWQVGDEISIAPTSENDYTGFERRTVTVINGRQITFNTATTIAHPAVGIPGQTAATPEVLNLTRNVRIEGKPPAAEFPRAGNNNSPGRTHIFINNSSAVTQNIQYASIRYTGPRQYDSGSGTSQYVLGRYGLHFHMSGGNNVGSIVQGVVVRDSGSHAFVAHESNGVTFSQTIAYNDDETPYWWDVKANEEGFLNNDPTNNTVYDQAVAALIDTDPFKGSQRLAGYSASCGTGNSVTNSIAIGVQGTVQTSAIFWPEGANACPNTWTVQDDVAHNNEGDAMFSWQNDTTDPHNQTHRIVSYRNGGACVEHGAYKNAFDYDHVTCVDDDGGFHPTSNNPNAQASVAVHAVSFDTDQQNWNDFIVRGNNRVPTILKTVAHEGGTTAPSTFRRWDVAGYTGTAVTIAEDPTLKAGAFDFVCWTLPAGAELTPSDFTISSIHPLSTYRIQQHDGTAYQLDPSTRTWSQLADFAVSPSGC